MSKEGKPGSIAPRRIDSGALVWVAPSAAPAGGVFTEKVVGQGEDAEPSFLRREERGGRGAVTFIGVYDGLGGSGARKVLEGSTEYTQAYLASRWVREASEAWYMDAVDSGGRLDPDALRQRIAHGLAHRQSLVPAASAGAPPASRVRSTMQRSYPTTLAAVAVTARAEGRNPTWDVEALWAGDSRCYVWTASAGLQQLSADHTKDDDILSQLVNDGPETLPITLRA